MKVLLPSDRLTFAGIDGILCGCCIAPTKQRTFIFQVEEVTVVEDLREQMIREDEEREVEEEGIAQRLLDLEPWQRLVLASLLFFDVALCGCMGLVMIGRIFPPF